MGPMVFIKEEAEQGAPWGFGLESGAVGEECRDQIDLPLCIFPGGNRSSLLSCPFPKPYLPS